MAETKSSYNEELRQRIRETFDGGYDVTFEDIYEFTRREALRSWKNGLETGRKRAAQRPNVKSAFIKGGALENGKLRPVHPEA